MVKRKYTDASKEAKESFSSNSSNRASILKLQRKQKKNHYFLRSCVMEGGVLLKETESVKFLEILKAMGMTARIQKKSLDWTKVGSEMKKIRGMRRISQTTLKFFLIYKNTEVMLFEELIQESGVHYCFLENRLKVDNGFWNNQYMTGKYQRFDEFKEFPNLVDWMLVLPIVLDNNCSTSHNQRSTSRSTTRNTTLRPDVNLDPSVEAWNKLCSMFGKGEVNITEDELQDLYEVFKKDKQDAICFLTSVLTPGPTEDWLRRRITNFFDDS